MTLTLEEYKSTTLTFSSFNRISLEEVTEESIRVLENAEKLQRGLEFQEYKIPLEFCVTLYLNLENQDRVKNLQDLVQDVLHDTATEHKGLERLIKQYSSKA